MWTLDRSEAVPCWRNTASPLILRFSTRLGGISAPPFDTLNLGRSTTDRPANVAENRRRFLVAAALDPDRLVTAGQVHGARIVEVTQPGHVMECDALLTRVPGLTLAVTIADCMPLLYVAPGAIAVVHAGWRGTAGDLPAIVLRALCAAADCGPDRVDVSLGPCIRACCYQVGTEVARRFPSDALRPDGDRWRLELPRVAARQLGEAGLPAGNFQDVGACTMCEPHFYFSHRRDGSPSGRHWAVAALRGHDL
jgi:YfiH family protein